MSESDRSAKRRNAVRPAGRERGPEWGSPVAKSFSLKAKSEGIAV